jgi:hypothetical protein
VATAVVGTGVAAEMMAAAITAGSQSAQPAYGVELT